MSIRRLKTLIAIAKTGTFAEASEIVHVSQAAVSQQMKSLEEDLQVTLFDRSRRPPVLNQIGLALISKARDVVYAYDTMLHTIVGEGALQGQLMIGAVPTAVTGLVPRTVTALRADYPELHIRISPGPSSSLMPQVDRQHLDAAILTEPNHVPNHMIWYPFAEEPLVLLAPLSATSDDPMALLATYPYIRFSRQAWVGGLIDHWLEKHDVQVEESMELDTLEAISTMVFHNLGVSIVPDRCVPSPHPLPLKRVPLRPPAAPRILGLLSRKDNIKFRLIEALGDTLTQIVLSAGKARTFGDNNPNGPPLKSI